MDYIKLIRPKHYVKNLLIFLPIFFSGQINNVGIDNLLFGFLAFCFCASAVYIINDIKDVNLDRKHKIKCNRSIASGRVSIGKAVFLILILMILSVLFSFLINMPLKSLSLLFVYLFINIIYSFGAKNYPIIDVMIIASGFVIRILYGAFLFDIEVSNWLYLTVLAISFYLALGKRRGEVLKFGNQSRKVLEFYNKDFLDKNMYMFLGMAIVFYCLWATDIKMVNISNNMLIWTIPIVILLCMKYSLNIEGDNDGDPIEIIFSDKLFILFTLIFIVMLAVILYF